MKHVKASGHTISEMRENFLASPEGRALWAEGDCTLIWVNEGDLYTAPSVDAALREYFDAVEAFDGSGITEAMVQRVNKARAIIRGAKA